MGFEDQPFLKTWVQYFGVFLFPLHNVSFDPSTTMFIHHSHPPLSPTTLTHLSFFSPLNANTFFPPHILKFWPDPLVSILFHFFLSPLLIPLYCPLVHPIPPITFSSSCRLSLCTLVCISFYWNSHAATLHSSVLLLSSLDIMYFSMYYVAVISIYNQCYLMTALHSGWDSLKVLLKGTSQQILRYHSTTKVMRLK